MKIVYILEQFNLHGGLERVVASKANWLAKNDYEIIFILNNQNNKPLVYHLDKTIKIIDLDIQYQIGKSYFYPSNLMQAPKHLFKLKKTLKRIKPDVVINLSLQFDYYALPFLTKAITIREFHSSRYDYKIRRTQNTSLLKKMLYSVSDFVEKKYTTNVVLTPEEKLFYPLKNTIVIPNGIDLKVPKKIQKQTKTIIAAGRLEKVKNFNALLRIWSKIHFDFPDWKLAIYGEGALKKELKIQVKLLNLENSICICGATDNLDLKMQQAAIFVMTSYTECYPMVLLEAKNAKLPILSYACPFGPQNMVNDGVDGILVANQDEDSFAKALKKLILDSQLRAQMREAAWNGIKKSDLNQVMKHWQMLFKTISNE